MKLIEKDALLAEIDRRIKVLQKNPYENHKTICHLDSLKQSIDTLEVKEMDLEKHLKEDIEDVYFDLNGVAVKGATYYLTVEDIKEIAKHFFELGLKAQKGG